MADRPVDLRTDAALEAALRDLGERIAWPGAASATAPDGTTGPDLAAIVRTRLEAADGTAHGARTGRSARPGGPAWRLGWRPARWALVAAVILLLALAALAGASVLGLPGLRLVFGPPPLTVSPPPSLAPSRTPAPGTPGQAMKLGVAVALVDLDARAGFAVVWPSDPAIGPPDAAYVDAALGDQVTLVWRSRDDLPDTLEPGVGLVLTEFRGAVDSGFLTKVLGDGTTAHAVRVHGQPAFWLTGDPHFFFYSGPDGFIHEERRWVGDALIWARGPLTYRLETSLGQASALQMAGSMP